jgi:hypothetical protein
MDLTWVYQTLKHTLGKTAMSEYWLGRFASTHSTHYGRCTDGPNIVQRVYFLLTSLVAPSLSACAVASLSRAKTHTEQTPTTPPAAHF